MNIIKRHLFDILKWPFPDAVISHRSASKLRPTETGNFFITSNYSKKITDFKGITLNEMEGKPALSSDISLDGITSLRNGDGSLKICKHQEKKEANQKPFPELNNYFIATNAYKEPSEGKLTL